ncbi:hypothetical protein O6H91_Y538200 [Diphasiastrum complanatum]|nr:hypothetical protein O6H91_Y538200 [Diphasiastrum complanatum]
MLSSVRTPVLDGDHPPVPSKKPTRQWDAWTRQEEENFFNALRQVGKVRHYYYRVIKRMNKLLGPGLILDAKNSKDANTALLHWWSLLEKHSCSASKLHLKPRRFKKFLKALEHRLLKDRKRTKRKQVPTVDSPFTSPASVSTSVNASVDGMSVRGEAQVTRKAGTRGSPVKRKSTSRKPVTSAEVTRPPRQRRKVSDGSLSSAAIKRWEKAASAGVTLMAEAAEHLERAAAAEQLERLGAAEQHISLQTNQKPVSSCSPEGKTNQRSSDIKVCAKGVPSGPALKVVPVTRVDNSTKLVDSRMFESMIAVSGMDSNACNSLSVSLPPRTIALQSSLLPSPSCGSTFSSGGVMFVPIQACKGLVEMPSNTTMYRDSICSAEGGRSSENNSSKLKLQLFPIDEFTRKALEQDGLNPHLELTLKGRKSIASVLQHLITKWGKSSIATGELRLFPFSTQWNNVANCQSWCSKDVAISAADVHETIGSSLTFRLRYGWLSSRVLQTSTAVLQEPHTPSAVDSDLHASRPRFGNGSCTGPSESINMQCAKAGIPETCSNLAFSKEGSPVHLQKTDFCEIAEVQKEAPVSKEKVSAVPVACLANCTVSSLTLDPVNTTVDDKGYYHACSSLQEGTKEEILERAHVNEALSEDGHRPQQFFRSSVASNELAEVANGARTAFTDSQVASCSWLYEESNDGFAQHLWSNEEPSRSSGGVILPSEVDWVDSFTNISIGELLCDVPRADIATVKGDSPYSSGKTDHPPPSLDCFKAAQTQQFPTEPMLRSTQTQQQSNIWCAEDTCDAFSFQRLHSSVNPGLSDGHFVVDKESPNVTTLGAHNEASSMPVLWRQVESKPLCEKDVSELQMRETSNLPSRDVEGLGASQIMPLELYLADSLGALSMGINQQSEGLQGQDFFLNGDSSLGFSGLIGVLGQGSLDALLGLSNQAENSSLSRQEKHSSFMLCENSNKGELFENQRISMGRGKSSFQQSFFESENRDMKDYEGFDQKGVSFARGAENCVSPTKDVSPTTSGCLKSSFGMKAMLNTDFQARGFSDLECPSMKDTLDSEAYEKHGERTAQLQLPPNLTVPEFAVSFQNLEQEDLNSAEEQCNESRITTAIGTAQSAYSVVAKSHIRSIDSCNKSSSDLLIEEDILVSLKSSSELGSELSTVHPDRVESGSQVLVTAMACSQPPTS